MAEHLLYKDAACNTWAISIAQWIRISEAQAWAWRMNKTGQCATPWKLENCPKWNSLAWSIQSGRGPYSLRCCSQKGAFSLMTESQERQQFWVLLKLYHFHNKYCWVLQGIAAIGLFRWLEGMCILFTNMTLTFIKFSVGLNAHLLLGYEELEEVRNVPSWLTFMCYCRHVPSWLILMCY